MTKIAFVLALIPACPGSHEPSPATTPVSDVATIRVFEEGIGASGRIAVFQDHSGAVRSERVNAFETVGVGIL